RDLHSFPTRRSSDLIPACGRRNGCRWRCHSARGLRFSGRRRCESPWYRAVAERFSCGWYSCDKDLRQNVDVVDDGEGAFLLKEENEIDVARAGGRGDADKRDLGGARATGVIHGIADVVDLAAGVGLEDTQQTFGMRFAILHVVHANPGMEDHAAGEAVQGEFGLDFGPSGEYGEPELPDGPKSRPN